MPIVKELVGGALVHDSSLVDGGDTSANGTLLSRTIAAGKHGKLMYASVVWGSGAADIELQIVRGATIVVVRKDTLDWEKDFGQGISLTGGDVVRLQITGQEAGNADGLLSVEEYDV